MKIAQTILFTTAGLLLLASARAAVFIIDDFDNASPPVSFNPPPNSSGGGPVSNEAGVLGGVMGGYRDIALYNVSNTSGSSGRWVSADTYGGAFSLSNDTAVNSVARITWDGNDGDGFNVAHNGLGSVDLTQGGAQGIRLDIDFIDLDTTLTFTVWYNGGANSTTASHIFPAAVNGYFFPFSAFDHPAAFGNVSAMMLEISGPPAFDTTISLIGTEVPEPSSLGPMGLVLVTISALRVVRLHTNRTRRSA